MNAPTFALIMALLAAPLAIAEDVAGFWKHPEEPIWMAVSTADGAGIMVRNDNRPDRVGFRILKDLTTKKSKENLWTGQVYAAKLEEYKNAEVSLPDPDVLRIKVKVGFISRTLDWARVDAVPVD